MLPRQKRRRPPIRIDRGLIDAVRHLTARKVMQADIVRRTGLSQASVRRIQRGDR